MTQRRSVVLLSLAVALGAVVGGDAIGDAGAELWVDGRSAACSDGHSRLQAGSSGTPWCSVVRAGAAATAGDTVHIQPAAYLGTVRPGSGTTFVAEADGVTIDAAGAQAAVKLSAVNDVTLRGIAVTGAVVQGIWASGVQRVTFDRLHVSGNGGPGIQVLNSTATTVTHSVLTGNGGAGIFEGVGTSGGIYVSNEITSNGLNGDPYNGDGIQIGGVGAYIAGNTIVANGDPGPFEHGSTPVPRRGTSSSRETSSVATQARTSRPRDQTGRFGSTGWRRGGSASSSVTTPLPSSPTTT